MPNFIIIVPILGIIMVLSSQSKEQQIEIKISSPEKLKEYTEALLAVLAKIQIDNCDPAFKNNL